MSILSQVYFQRYLELINDVFFSIKFKSSDYDSTDEWQIIGFFVNEKLVIKQTEKRKKKRLSKSKVSEQVLW